MKLHIVVSAMVRVAFSVAAVALLPVPGLCADLSEKPLVWQFHTVGTPGFLGPPKIGNPLYVEPKPLNVQTPEHVPCAATQVFGEFEAYIDESGRVKSVISHHEPVEGNDCQKRYVFPIIRNWQFAPATFEGKATPVHMWIGVFFK